MSVHTSTVTTKGQTTVPEPRRARGFHPGERGRALTALRALSGASLFQTRDLLLALGETGRQSGQRAGIIRPQRSLGALLG